MARKQRRKTKAIVSRVVKTAARRSTTKAKEVAKKAETLMTPAAGAAAAAGAAFGSALGARIVHSGKLTNNQTAAALVAAGAATSVCFRSACTIHSHREEMVGFCGHWQEPLAGQRVSSGAESRGRTEWRLRMRPGYPRALLNARGQPERDLRSHGGISTPTGVLIRVGVLEGLGRRRPTSSRPDPSRRQY